ncbi:MAG: NTP transferase domain-containing protein, partial [Stygiolobus sp.]|nr:NTP transferase domain-containing protein [Stygiolobus sp.]
MRAIILAAGAGERLEPITHTRPKPLIPILNKPLINYWIENLRACVIKDISVVINPSHKDFFSRLGVDLIFQTEGKGTGKALLSAKGIKDEILVIYSDVFLGDFSVLCKISNEGNSVLGVRVENPKEYGVLSVSSDGSLREIIEKPENPPSNLINSGVYKLDSDIFHYLEKISLSPRGELELTDAVTLMAKDKKIKVIEYSNYWIDIGRPWNIIDVNKWALDNLVSSKNFGNIEDGVKIKGKVIIEDCVEIRSGTYIEGPVYIGKNSIIGPNSYLRPYTVLTENV